MEDSTIIMKKGQFLSEVIKDIPAGRLNKRYSGIGATTHEIRNQRRNSIIVFPTRALAATKAIKESILYVGGKYPGVQRSSVEDIKNNLKENGATKIAAVADSFAVLYEQMGDVLAANFFLMLDEIDSFQSESYYRDSLEDCLEIYFQFPPERRSMVTATWQYSLDDQIEDEPYHAIRLEGYVKSQLNLIHCTGDMKLAVAEEIKATYSKLVDEDKIVVGYNSIIDILSVIHLIQGTVPDHEISILAGEGSDHKVDKPFKTNVIGGKLEKKITFITSAYFVGIDFEEDCHMVVVSDLSRSYAVLTKAKIQQIFGRCRRKLLSATMIYECRPQYYRDGKEYNKYLLDKLNDSYNAYVELKKSSSSIQIDKNVRKNLIDTYCNSTKINDVSILRVKNGGIIKTRLALDYLLYHQVTLNTLYNNSVLTESKFCTMYDVVHRVFHHLLTTKDRKEIADQIIRIEDKEIDEALLVMDKISDPLANINPKTSLGKKVEVIANFATTHYMSSTEVINQIKPIIINKARRKALNKYITKIEYFQMIAGNSDLRNDLYRELVVNDKLTPKEIRSKMVRIFALDHPNKIIRSSDLSNEAKAVSVLKSLCVVKRTSVHGSDDKYYKIVKYISPHNVFE